LVFGGILISALDIIIVFSMLCKIHL